MSKNIKKLTTTYWKATISRRLKAQKENTSVAWTPAPLGFLKLNFDAAFKNGKAITGVILHNQDEKIVGDWINRFDSHNAFCVEAKAAIQALQIAADLDIQKAQFKGDAYNVILAILDSPHSVH